MADKFWAGKTSYRGCLHDHELASYDPSLHPYLQKYLFSHYTKGDGGDATASDAQACSDQSSTAHTPSEIVIPGNESATGTGHAMGIQDLQALAKDKKSAAKPAPAQHTLEPSITLGAFNHQDMAIFKASCLLEWPTPLLKFLDAMTDGLPRTQSVSQLEALIRSAQEAALRHSTTSGLLTHGGSKNNKETLLPPELVELCLDPIFNPTRDRTMWLTFDYSPAGGLKGVSEALAMKIADGRWEPDDEKFPLMLLEDSRYRELWFPRTQKVMFYVKFLPSWTVFLDILAQGLSLSRQLGVLSPDFLVNVRQLVIRRKSQQYQLDVDELAGLGHILGVLSDNVRYSCDDVNRTPSSAPLQPGRFFDSVDCLVVEGYAQNLSFASVHYLLWFEVPRQRIRYLTYRPFGQYVQHAILYLKYNRDDQSIPESDRIGVPSHNATDTLEELKAKKDQGADWEELYVARKEFDTISGNKDFVMP